MRRGHGMTRIPTPVCSSTKRAYRRRREASRALRMIQTFGGECRVIYRCNECGWYHLSSRRDAA